MFSYIHIPFCESKCKYCRFASIKTNNSMIQVYISNLLKEIIEFKKSSFDKNELLKSIYFWWWTPSILSKKDLSSIIEIMKDTFIFSKNIEITLETTPQNLTKENIINYEEIWVNRISIWIQTLKNKTLKTIWRNTNKYIFKWLDNLKKSKIKNISVDFIIWLPYVKRWETLKNIKTIFKKYSFIKHISVYMLEDYYETEDFWDLYDNITYPENWKNLWLDEKYFNKEYIEIKNFLENKWFNRYEISNYAKKWYECKHNKSYWKHQNNIWFWLWAHSFLDNTRFANSENFLDYYSKKWIKKEYLTKKDILIEKIMFSLRTYWMNKTLEKYLNKDKIKYYLKEKFLIRYWNKIIINDKKIVFLDTILSDIIL